MTTQNRTVTAITSPKQASGYVKMIMGLREGMVLIEFNNFIRLVAQTRKLQKQYYVCQDKERKKLLLIECKRREAKIETEGNRIWKEYKLARFSNPGNNQEQEK